MASDADAADHKPRVVVLIGPESTGKSTLAERLASRFSAPLSREFARNYVAERMTPLDHTDVEAIARGQMALEDATRVSAARAAPLLIKDTDLVSTLVYARYYHGHAPHWLERAAAERLGDLYLLCAPDVPWVPDGLQRDRPHTRIEVHTRFAETLSALQVDSVSIAGGWATREATAIAVVERLLSRNPL
jgi:NadR type nicotinamide-nucleotide adenylyltransferase